MDPTGLRTLKLIESLLRWLTYHATPLTTLSALALGGLAIVASFIARLCDLKTSPPPRFLLDMLVLWAIACASTVVWLKGVLILHSQGLA
jgi:hypothetical protein